MLTFEWDALRNGDLVLVHDDEDVGGPLLTGVVSIVDRGRRGRGGSDIGVRTTERDGTTRVRRPARLATHLQADGRDARCWRCAATSVDA